MSLVTFFRWSGVNNSVAESYFNDHYCITATQKLYGSRASVCVCKSVRFVWNRQLFIRGVHVTD